MAMQKKINIYDNEFIQEMSTLYPISTTMLLFQREGKSFSSWIEYAINELNLPKWIYEKDFNKLNKKQSEEGLLIALYGNFWRTGDYKIDEKDVHKVYTCITFILNFKNMNKCMGINIVDINIDDKDFFNTSFNKNESITIVEKK